ncbi:MAG: ATP-binding protein, partial [Candidatus Electrothrix sp. AUS1_2]|nr:ATP-binding protein [Candidatus Electrothrix sp. AUS1_2]
MSQEVIGKKNIVAGRDIHITLPPEKPSLPPPLSGKFDLSRLPKTDSKLFGREDELALIDQAWQEDGINVLVLTAMGGAGKTALMQKWIDDEHWRGADAVYTWSFYSQGSSEDRQARCQRIPPPMPACPRSNPVNKTTKYRPHP